MNATSLRRYAAAMYPTAQEQIEKPIRSRPLHGNELTLTRLSAEMQSYSLTLRREEIEIAAEDLMAVIEAFCVPDRVAPQMRIARERNLVSDRSINVYYATWRWVE
jgi:hypothetical protein